MTIRALIFLLVFPGMLYAQTERTIRLDAKANALLLTTSNAKMVGNLTPNQPYTISVTANSVHAPMQGAFFALANPTGGFVKYVASGQSFTFVPANSSFQLAAFYVDWSLTTDNSGTVTVNITGPTSQTLTIDAKNDAILLDTAKSTIVGSLAQDTTYAVSVSDSALSGVLASGVCFMYQDAAGVFGFRYVPSGSAFTFMPGSASLPYQVIPFFVDWSTLNDNTGALFVKFKPPLQPILRTIRLDAKANALLLTSSNAKMVGNLTPNQPYTISVTANSVHAPMQGAFFALANPTGGFVKYVASGQSFTFVPANSSFQLAAFYVDWSLTTDNSGTVTVNITGPTSQTLTIDAKNDAILLDTAKSTIVGSLISNQTYAVSVRDSALSGILASGVCFMYQDAAGVFGFRYVPSGSAFTFMPGSASLPYQVIPFFVDWSTLNDNKGALYVDFDKVTAVSGAVTPPQQFFLSQNYPNPFNPSTTIKYELPRTSQVNLSVYDILGRQVSVLVNDRRDAGSYEVKFDGSAFASGVYFYRLQAGTYVVTKKLLLLR